MMHVTLAYGATDDNKKMGADQAVSLMTRFSVTWNNPVDH